MMSKWFGFKKKSVATEPSQSREIVLQALEDLQCNPKLYAEHPECIDFEYQGEDFRIIAQEGHAFVMMYDGYWAAIDATNLDDVSNMRRAINDLNWAYVGSINYTKDDSKNMLDLHTSYSMLCTDNKGFKDYLQAMMRESFRIHREFHRRMDIARSK